MKPLKNDFFPAIRKFFPYIFIAMVAFVLYAQTLNYGITGLDDNIFIHVNSEKYDSPTAITDAFQTDTFFNTVSVLYYRPVLALSFILDHKFAGESESFAHLTNILLHCISAMLVFFFFKKYLLNRSLSFFAAILFAVHPITIQTVAWIPGRNDSLFFIFFILCLIFFIEYMRYGKHISLELHIIFLLLNLFTKESAVILPLIFTLFFLAYKEKFKMPLRFPVLIVWVISTAIFFIARDTVLPRDHFKLHFELSNLNFAAFFDHISAVLFLRAPMAEHRDSMIFILGIISVLVMIFLAFYRKDKGQIKEMLFFLTIPVIFLAPDFISGDYKINRIMFHGNRMYLPFFAFLAVFFSFINTLISQNVKLKNFIYVCLAAVIFLAAAITYKNTAYLQNNLAFWERIVKENKEVSILAVSPYIDALIENDEIEEALKQSEYYALLSDYDDMTLLALLVRLYIIYGFYDKAEEYAEKVISNAGKKDIYSYLNSYIINLRLNNDQKADYYYNLLISMTQFSRKELAYQISKYEEYLEGKRKHITNLSY